MLGEKCCLPTKPPIIKCCSRCPGACKLQYDCIAWNKQTTEQIKTQNHAKNAKFFETTNKWAPYGVRSLRFYGNTREYIVFHTWEVYLVRHPCEINGSWFDWQWTRWLWMCIKLLVNHYHQDIEKMWWNQQKPKILLDSRIASNKPFVINAKGWKGHTEKLSKLRTFWNTPENCVCSSSTFNLIRLLLHVSVYNLSVKR